jgi:uncharacterized UPF0160 family protein
VEKNRKMNLKQTEALKNEVDMIKQVQKTQTNMTKLKQRKWDEEMRSLKEEKKKLEYMIFDMLKASGLTMISLRSSRNYVMIDFLFPMLLFICPKN